MARLEALMRRTLRPQKPGRKAAKADIDTTGDLFAGTGEWVSCHRNPVIHN
jgi:hypothetical protein